MNLPPELCLFLVGFTRSECSSFNFLPIAPARNSVLNTDKPVVLCTFLETGSLKISGSARVRKSISRKDLGRNLDWFGDKRGCTTGISK